MYIHMQSYIKNYSFTYICIYTYIHTYINICQNRYDSWCPRIYSLAGGAWGADINQRMSRNAHAVLLKVDECFEGKCWAME